MPSVVKLEMYFLGKCVNFITLVYQCAACSLVIPTGIGSGSINCIDSTLFVSGRPSTLQKAVIFKSRVVLHLRSGDDQRSG